ncbi:MAG TPA: hypothetical protein VHF89_08240, partial [Solirubrobacteraceae bacterium]|nr:hypothetical protein [Solirubrobacteraceae bacterium]
AAAPPRRVGDRGVFDPGFTETELKDWIRATASEEPEGFARACARDIELRPQDGAGTGTKHRGLEVRHWSHGMRDNPAESCSVFYTFDPATGVVTIVGLGFHVAKKDARYGFWWADPDWVAAWGAKRVHGTDYLDLKRK